MLTHEKCEPSVHDREDSVCRCGADVATVAGGRARASHRWSVLAAGAGGVSRSTTILESPAETVVSLNSAMLRRLIAYCVGMRHATASVLWAMISPSRER